MLAALVGCGTSSPLGEGPAIVRGGSPLSPEVWRRDLGRALEFPPLWIGDGWVAVATEGALWRLAAADGHEIWRKKLPSTPSAPPILCGDVLVVATDAPAGEVLGVDRDSGKIRWKWGRGIARAVGHDSVLVLALRGGRIVRIDPAKGEKIWEGRLPGAAWRDPAILDAEGLAVFPVRPDSLIALRLADGTRAWSRQVGLWPTVARGDGPLAVTTDDGTLVLLDPATGNERGRQALGGMPAGASLLHQGTVFVARRDGAVSAYEAQTLAMRWSRVVGRPLLTGPSAGGDAVFQPGDRGVLHVLRGSDGSPIGDYPHPEPLLSAPVEGNGMLAVAGSRGTLVVYRRSS